MNISSRLKYVIENSRLTITEAANQCEIPYSSMQNYLRGEREPKVDALVAIGSRLGISIDWLLTGRGSMHRNETGQAAALTPRQTALLELFNALDSEGQREIQAAAEKQKHLIELEERISKLEACGADSKKMA